LTQPKRRRGRDLVESRRAGGRKAIRYR
jgi:hypothetical protein